MSELEKRINRFLNRKITWGYLHISDGVDSCSGTDQEEEKKAKKSFKKFILKLLEEQK